MDIKGDEGSFTIEEEWIAAMLMERMRTAKSSSVRSFGLAINHVSKSFLGYN
jgi:hypothetical protein